MENREADVVIVGAGVVGSLIASALSRYDLDIVLIDKESDVAEGTTKANTAIVHGGYDAKPGSLKAKLNVAGNAMFDQVCSDLDVEFDRCGTYVVGSTQQDLITLNELLERGQENNVPGLEIISGEEMRLREPGITPAVTGALLARTGGIVDPFNLCIAAAEHAVLNGTRVLLNTRVTGLIKDKNQVTGVTTNKGELRAKWVIVAAGLWADELMASAGIYGFTIKPRKGEYYVLDRRATRYVHNVLFPCPTLVSKGILVTRTIHGNVMLGPNANSVDDKTDLSTTAEGLEEVMSGALKLVPGINRRDIIRTFSGLRASGSTGDFYIESPCHTQGLVVLAGIESPGLTASPAIAQYVISLLAQAGMELNEKKDYIATRQAIPRFSHLSRDEQDELIRQDPRYGNVICRCETVTEGEIVAACHAPIPAQTYDAVKRRTRIGTGRCQGSFDMPLVIDIMARELNMDPLELTKRGDGSHLLNRKTKEVAE